MRVCLMAFSFRVYLRTKSFEGIQGVFMRNAARLLLLAGLALVVSTWRASADTVWDVNATFSYDGLTNNASGSFTLDSSLDLVTWNLMVDGTNTPADNDYTTGDSIAIYPDQTHLDFYDGGTNQYIDLYFASPLSTAGGTINLLYGDGGESSDSTIVCDGAAHSSREMFQLFQLFRSRLQSPFVWPACSR